MGLYQRFLNFEVVINVTSEKEWKQLVSRFKILRINSPWMNSLSFMDLHMNAGIRAIPLGQVCIEYTMDKGITFASKKSYVDYGCEVCSVDEFLEATK